MTTENTDKGQTLTEADSQGHCALGDGSPLSFEEFWKDAPTTTPRSDAREEQQKNLLCGAANLDLARTLERENAALKKRIAMADATVVACHSAMLGKVNPKHPAWGLVYAYEDQANK